MKGNVFDIKKFAVHDGPGIRTTLFLKGCPLACVWCQNPEGMQLSSGLWYFEQKCIRCGACIKACTHQALSMGKDDESFIMIDRDACQLCGTCVDVCPSTAMTMDSRQMSVEDVVAELLKDRSFYEHSNGGITLSGGDPLFQSSFSLEVLRRCKEEGVHTAIETCMFAKESVIRRFMEVVDFFIVDIKLFDADEHKKYTGQRNEQILSNFKILAEEHGNLLVRIPLIPDITTKKENLQAIGRFVSSISKEIPIELINFNPLAENKYRLMGREYEFLSVMKPYSEHELDNFYQILISEEAAIQREQ